MCMKNGRLYAFRFGSFLACIDTKSGETAWHHTAPPSGILGWLTGTNAAGRATTGRRTRISPPGGGSARCNASKAWAQRKDFSPFMLPPTTPSTSNATSFRLKRTAVSGPQLWRHGSKQLARHEQRREGQVFTLIGRQRDSALLRPSAEWRSTNAL